MTGQGGHNMRMHQKYGDNDQEQANYEVQPGTKSHAELVVQLSGDAVTPEIKSATIKQKGLTSHAKNSMAPNFDTKMNVKFNSHMICETDKQEKAQGDGS